MENTTNRHFSSWIAVVLCCLLQVWTRTILTSVAVTAFDVECFRLLVSQGERTDACFRPAWPLVLSTCFWFSRLIILKLSKKVCYKNIEKNAQNLWTGNFSFFAFCEFTKCPRYVSRVEQTFLNEVLQLGSFDSLSSVNSHCLNVSSLA